MLSTRHLIMSVCLLIACALNHTVYGQCPPCYYNGPSPMLGGCCDTCPDGSGRRVIKVRIDGSWDNSPGQTNANIWNGVTQAINRWNNATDPSGFKTNYCFQLDQSAQAPDILIKKANPATGCAAINRNSATNQWILKLPDPNRNYTQDVVAGRVAHEIGHSIGIAHTNACLSRMAYLNMKGEMKTVDPKEIKIPPPTHEQLPAELIGRIRLIRAALLGVYPHSMKYWVDGFRGDAHPSREIQIGERLSACYIEYVSMTDLTREQHDQVYKILLSMSCGVEIDDLVENAKGLPEDALEKLDLLFGYAYPVYEIEDTEFPQGYTVSEEDKERLQFDKEEFPFDVPTDLIKKLLKEDE